MTTEELTYVNAIIDLSFAISNNDLEKVKQLVNIINLNIPDGEMYLNDALGFNVKNVFDYNESLIYVLDNLQHIANAEQVKWGFHTQYLIEQYKISNDSTNIAFFIQSNINSIEHFKVMQLIRLCHVIKDYDSLIKIQNSLNKEV